MRRALRSLMPALAAASSWDLFFAVFHIEANLLIGDSGSWHGADLFLRPELGHPEPPPTRRRRWLVVYGGYAAFDSSPPAIMIVVIPDRMIVAWDDVPLAVEG